MEVKKVEAKEDGGGGERVGVDVPL